MVKYKLISTEMDGIQREIITTTISDKHSETSLELVNYSDLLLSLFSWVIKNEEDDKYVFDFISQINLINIVDFSTNTENGILLFYQSVLSFNDFFSKTIHRTLSVKRIVLA